MRLPWVEPEYSTDAPRRRSALDRRSDGQRWFRTAYFCEGFRMLAVAQVGTGRGAGVRKPPGKEPAGRSSVAGRSMAISASRTGVPRDGERVESKDRQRW